MIALIRGPMTGISKMKFITRATRFQMNATTSHTTRMIFFQTHTKIFRMKITSEQNQLSGQGHFLHRFS